MTRKGQQGLYNQSQSNASHCERQQNKDFTNNAKNINNDSVKIPNSVPPVKDGTVHKFETVVPSRSSSLEKYSNIPTQSLRTVKSLTRVPSLETPLGVIRQRSLHAFDPMYAHSGTSQDSARRARPIFEVDDSSNDQTEDKSKYKKGKIQRSFALSEEMVEVSLENENEAIEEITDTSSKGKQLNGRFQRFADFLKKMFPCTKSNEKDLDPDRLLNIDSCPQEV